MFKKIVSRLPYSPSMVQSLGFYAKRLRKEEITRKIGLILTVMALVIQSFVVFSPPESANAASSNDLIYGGIDAGDDNQRKTKLLANYDGNANNIRDLFNEIGITRAELESAANGGTQWLKSTLSGAYSWGMNPHFSAAQGEGSYTVKASQGGTRTFYYRPHHLWGNYNYRAFVGNSSRVGWFAIMFACGNLILKSVPPAPTCPPGQTGNYPNCSIPPSPTATCNTLSISQNNGIYQLTANGSAANGATIRGYTFNIYKGNTLIKTINSTNSTVSHQLKEPGSYKVTLTIKTSLGDRTSTNCEKTFTIPEPEKCPQNPNLLKNDPKCQPCPGDSTLWINDEKCSASFVQTKRSINMTQDNADASKVTAKSGDKVTYTLSAHNKGLNEEEYVFRDYVGDLLEYADIVDNGGGTLTKDTNGSGNNQNSHILTWSGVKIKPGETQERSFTIQIKSNISAMAAGHSNATSYDCRVDNTFGNTVSFNVDCPTPKVIEQTVAQLPKTGPGENMLFAGILAAVVVFFYARSRQLSKEVRIIRHDMSAGTI